MGKKKGNLIGLSLVLILLVGALFVLVNRDETLDDSTDKKAEVNTSIPLTDFAYGEIKSITVYKNEDMYTLSKMDNTWVIDGSQSGYELNQASIGKMFRKLTELEALSQIEATTPDDLSQYGLAKPTALTIEIEGKGIREVFIGNQTVKASYYAMVSGDPAVYEIDLEAGEILSASLNAYRLKDIMEPIDVMTLEQLSIGRNDTTTIELTASPFNEVQTSATHKLTQPYEAPREVNGDRTEALFEAINTLVTATDIVEDQVKDLAVYGLETPELKLLVKDPQQEVTLLVGDYIDGDNQEVYCMVEGQDTIYRIDGSAIDYLSSVEAYELIFHFIMLVNVDTIDEIVIYNKEEQYVLTIEEDAYYIDDKVLSPEQFVGIYQSIIGLSSDAEAEETTRIEDSTITIEYHNRAEGTMVGQVDFVPYNEFFYGAYANDVYMFVVAKENVDEIFNALGKLTIGTN